MTSQLCEDLAKMRNDDFQGMEDDHDQYHLDIDSALVMSSLLEESQSDERDEDRLNSLIKSLEDEIKASKTLMEGEDSFFFTEAAVPSSSEEDSQSCNLVGQIDDPDYFDSCNNFETFRWVDDHMGLVPSSPIDHFSSYMEHYDMDGVLEGGAQNYYSDHVCSNGMMHMEELHGTFHSSLWQETYNNFELMCD